MNVYEFAMLFCLLFLFTTIELIRRQKIEERYALLWLALGFFMMLLSGFPKVLDGLSRMVRVHYAPSLLFLTGMACLFLFIMHLTIVISRLNRRMTRLVQELALLKAEHDSALEPEEGRRG